MSKTPILYIAGTNSRKAIAKRLGLNDSTFYWLETAAATYLDDYYQLKVPFSPLVRYQTWVLEQLSRIRRSDKKLSRKRIEATLKNNPQIFSIQQYLKTINQGA